MGSIRRWAVAAALLVIASLALVTPAKAATRAVQAPLHTAAVHPLAPYPSCGGHFTLIRSGSDVRITGNSLYVFSKGYMLVYAAANGKDFGPYNASPYGGANFEINTGSKSQTTIAISLTDDNNTVTLCASDYYA